MQRAVTVLENQFVWDSTVYISDLQLCVDNDISVIALQYDLFDLDVSGCVGSQYTPYDGSSSRSYEKVVNGYRRKLFERLVTFERNAKAMENSKGVLRQR